MTRRKLYIVNSSSLKNKLRGIIKNKYGTLKQFALDNNFKKKTVWSWFEKKSKRIPLSIIDKCLNECVWEFLDKERATTIGNLSIRISRNITTKEAIILGWFLSEGSIGQYNVTISQSSREILESIKKVIQNNYDINSGLRILPDKPTTYKLYIPKVFGYYLTSRFAIPLGKKSHVITVPEEIKRENDEVKLAFLAGYLEGDGSFTYYKRFINNKTFRAPRIVISTMSSVLAKDLIELYQSLGYKPKKRMDKKSDEFKIEILRFNEIIRLFFDISPYLLSKQKIKIYLGLLSQERLLDAVFIPENGIIREYYDKLKRWAKVSYYISTEIEYPITFYSVKNWAYGYFNPPLKVLVGLCDLSQKNYFDYIPIEYSALLLAQNKIKIKQFKSLRKTRFISNYFK